MDNYIAWKRRLEQILDDLDLWALVQGTETQPIPINIRNATAVEAQEITDQVKKDKKARKEICLRVSDEYLSYIDQGMTGREIWDRLPGIFESKAAGGVINIH